VVALLGGDAVAPEIDSVHALSEAGVDAAFARLKSRRARGKVLFDMQVA